MSCDWAGPSSFHSVPTVPRKLQIPPPLHIRRAANPLAEDMDVEDLIRPMFAWMDKLFTNTLGFAVLLAFFQIVGWEPLDRSQLYIVWREGRPSVLSFLEVQDHAWAGVGLENFGRLLQRPSTATVACVLFFEGVVYIAATFMDSTAHWDFGPRSDGSFEGWRRRFQTCAAQHRLADQRGALFS